MTRSVTSSMTVIVPTTAPPSTSGAMRALCGISVQPAPRLRRSAAGTCGSGAARTPHLAGERVAVVAHRGRASPDAGQTLEERPADHVVGRGRPVCARASGSSCGRPGRSSVMKMPCDRRAPRTSAASRRRAASRRSPAWRHRLAAAPSPRPRGSAGRATPRSARSPGSRVTSASRSRKPACTTSA